MRREPGPEARRLKVAVLLRHFSVQGGGAERYAVALVEQLAARHEIHVFAQEMAHHWPSVHYHRISCPWPKPRWINQLWFAALAWWATRRGFDLVHSHENTWHGQVQTMHVLPVRHNLFEGRSGWRRALRWLQVASSPRLLTYLAMEAARLRPRPHRVVVAASQTLRDTLARAYPASAPHLHVLTPGIGLPAQVRSPEASARARAQLGLDSAPVRRWLLLVGNDYRKKGLGCALQALVQLPADVGLAVAGKTDQRAVFMEEAARLGLGERVRFLGSLPDMSAAYLAADLLIHPTLEDTFAMAVLEAMAHGLPVVLSGPRHCGIAALLQDGDQALLLRDPRSPEELCAAVRKVLDDKTLALALRAQGLAFAARHEWPAVAQGQDALYRLAADSA